MNRKTGVKCKIPITTCASASEPRLEGKKFTPVTIKSHEFKPANLRGTTNIKNDIRSHVDDIYEFQSNMPPTALADSFDVRPSGDNKAMIQEPENMETNHDLTTRTSEERHDHAEKDDAATTAASEELKHTTISDKVHDASAEDMAVAVAESVVEDKDMEGAPKRHTPEPDTSDIQDEEMRERISSPKKKRGRDLDDEARDVESADPDDTASSADGIVNGSRTIRSGPEKKRPRDTSIGPTKSSEKATDVKENAGIDASDKAQSTPADADSSKKSPTSSPKPIFGSAVTEQSKTSTSAFASSGFASLASSSSPFGSLGTSKPSVFGGKAATTSSFGTLASANSPSTTTTTTITGATPGDKPASGFSFGGGSTSGFGGLTSGSVFGSALGNGFAGGAGPKLSSFAAPGQDNTLGAKPAKAFGAPDSGDENGSDAGDSEGDADTDDEEEGVKISPEDKRKTKVVKIEDGESGEATLLQIRAKIFALESKESGWKERGVGTLKINVPKSCADYDENGVPIPGSFDASGLEDGDDDDTNAPRVPRLIMRQENTHRVILNTIIVRAMKFEDKPATSTAQILFTAFEGEKESKPINMLLKMSENNARLFRSEIDSIQHEL